MKLGVNNSIGLGTKKAGLRPMDGGPTKVNVPNSHPSNPVHEQAMQAQGLGKKKHQESQGTPVSAPAPMHTDSESEWAPTQSGSEIETHEINKAILVVGAVALAGTLIIWMR